MRAKLYSANEIETTPTTVITWLSYWSQWWPSQFQPETISSTLATNFFAANVIKHIPFTKNPGWENMNPFAFGENSDFLISAHHQNDIIGHKKMVRPK